jgi:hypothetical protein
MCRLGEVGKNDQRSHSDRSSPGTRRTERTNFSGSALCFGSSEDSCKTRRFRNNGYVQSPKIQKMRGCGDLFGTHSSLFVVKMSSMSQYYITTSPNMSQNTYQRNAEEEADRLIGLFNKTSGRHDGHLDDTTARLIGRN